MEEQKDKCQKEAAAAKEIEVQTREKLDAALEAKAGALKRCEEIEKKLLMAEVCSRSQSSLLYVLPDSRREHKLCHSRV